MSRMEMVDALTSDCRVLLARYEEKQSLRFEDFCEVWKKEKFALIFHVGTRESERIQIVECLFRILGNYVIPTYPLQYQVGAIYSIYAIYYSQLVTPRVKIRMTLSSWNDLMNLQMEVKEQNHFDVNYVISKLRKDKAFLFVAMPIQLAFDSRDVISQYEKALIKENKSSNTVKNLQDVIQNVDEINAVYEAAKMKICSPNEGEPLIDPVTLRVASSDLVSHLERDLDDFKKWKEACKRNFKAKHLQRLELGLPVDRENESDRQELGLEKLTRADVVKEIKNRSLSSVAQVTKGKRRYQPFAANSTRSPRLKKSKKISKS